VRAEARTFKLTNPMAWAYMDQHHVMGLAVTDHADNEFGRFDEALAIWDRPQFTVSEVCKITGATPKALEHFLTPSRGFVRLMGSWVNPGTGKRRIFTGGQVLQIAAAYAMNRIGFPQRWSVVLADTVARRATARSIGLSVQTEMSLVSYPMSNGDWAAIPIYAEMMAPPKLPVSVQVLDVDRLINEVRQQLQAIVAGDEIPDFSVPDIAPEPNWFGPKGGSGDWVKDDLGNWLLVGLTHDETREYMDLQGWRLEGDELVYDASPRLYGERLERSVFLANKRARGGAE